MDPLFRELARSSWLPELTAFFAVLRLMPEAARALLEKLLQRTLSKIDSVTGVKPAERAALRSQVNNTPGLLLKLLVAQALLKPLRRSRSERLAGSFLAMGAGVIGGTLGQDYKRQWIDDLGQAAEDGKIPVVMFVNAVSCFISSFEICWDEKTGPGLRRRFTGPHRLLCQYADAAARSPLSAMIMIALPATPIIAFAVYEPWALFGLGEWGLAAGAAAVIEVPHRTHRWQRERRLATIAAAENET